MALHEAHHLRQVPNLRVCPGSAHVLRGIPEMVQDLPALQMPYRKVLLRLSASGARMVNCVSTGILRCQCSSIEASYSHGSRSSQTGSWCVAKES